MKTLTNETLCALAQNGDEQAREQLVLNNLPFIQKTANSMMANPAKARRLSVCGITVDDLIGAGVLGLLDSIEGYEPSSGNAFLTYAAQAAKNAIRDEINLYCHEFTCRASLDPSCSVKVVSWERLCSGSDSSDDSGDTADSLIPITSFRVTEDTILCRETNREVRKAVKLLPDREKVYVRYRFGLVDDELHSLAETAEVFHLSESRARGIEKSALDKVKYNLLVVFSEQAFSKAEDSLTRLLVAEKELHAVELRLKSQKKHGRKITAVVYKYLADYDGYCGELRYDFAHGSAEVMALAEWDTTITRRFAMRAIEHFQNHGSNTIPDRLVLTFIVPEDYTV